MIEHAYAVIMAGGGGTRLWPVSRRSRPKQMLTFGRSRTLYQMAVDRLADFFGPEHIFVVTVADQAGVLQEQTPEIPLENYLLEPMPRGTASVVGLAAVALAQRDPQAVMAVMASDHLIDNVPFFHQALSAGLEAAGQGYLVTLGISPTYPATGYGYIQMGAQIGVMAGLPVYRASKFKEKPRRELAEQFIAGGDHAWNSGMFLWTAARIRGEFRRLMPDFEIKLDEIERGWQGSERLETIARVWPTIAPETIDFGIMEKAERVAVIPVQDLRWDDVGSWESLYDVLPEDENTNRVVGAECISEDAHRNLIFSETGRLVAAIGVDDLVVIDTGDALLICRRDQTQQVRRVVDRLKKDNRNAYL